VLPISDRFNDFSRAFAVRLQREGYQCELDDSCETLKKKIRNAQLKQCNYMLVVGQDELDAGVVDVRDRATNASIGKFSVD
jgi:threonyl-tRNA synthetase